MTTAAIVQARIGSTRLPAKVLLPLPTGRTVLGEVLLRCKQIAGVDVVVVALPDTPENDILLPYVPSDVKVARGPEMDVLARYVMAAAGVEADVVMRITSDCPLLDPLVCGQVLALFNEGDADYCSNVERRSFPQGFDCQVFSRTMLDRAHREAVDPSDREHVCPFMQRHGRVASFVGLHDRSGLRWTLDTLDDYRRIVAVFEANGLEDQPLRRAG